jgi:predicted acetyltransferase
MAHADALLSDIQSLQKLIDGTKDSTESAVVAQRQKDQGRLDAKKTELASLYAKTATAASMAEELKAQQENDSTFLRQRGFAVNLGYGYFTSLRTYAPDVEVRYNFRQPKQFKEYVEDRKAHRVGQLRDRPGLSDYVTDVSGWIGYPLEKLSNRERMEGTTLHKADTAKESPLLVGLGLGIGKGDEFSSAFSINAGVAVFNNRGPFKSPDFYVGVSVDAVTFKTIARALTAAIAK